MGRTLLSPFHGFLLLSWRYFLFLSMTCGPPSSRALCMRLRGLPKPMRLRNDLIVVRVFHFAITLSFQRLLEGAVPAFGVLVLRHRVLR